MSNNQLPAEVQLSEDIQVKVCTEATAYLKKLVAEKRNPCMYAVTDYIAGATAWAIWKGKYDELKAQSGPEWIKVIDGLPGLDKPVKWRLIGQTYENKPTALLQITGMLSSLKDWEWLDETATATLKAQSAVWVKASDRVPENSNLVHLNYSTGKTDLKTTGYYEPSEKQWHNQNGTLLGWAPNLEWLDESGATDLQDKYDELKAENEELKERANKFEGAYLELNAEHAALKERADMMETALNAICGNNMPVPAKHDMIAIARTALAWKGEVAPAKQPVKEVAITFADWIKHSAKGYDPICEKWVYGEDELRYSTAELYDIFKQQKPGPGEKEGDNEG